MAESNNYEGHGSRYRPQVGYNRRRSGRNSSNDDGMTRYNNSKPHRSRGFPAKRHNEYPNFDKNKRTRVERKPLLPVFSSSGLLELDSNNKNGIPLKHVEPADAVSPEKFYSSAQQSLQFKGILYARDGNDPVKEFNLNDRSCYLIGRKDDGPEDIADIGIAEETCSQQHCVVQFRRKENKLVPFLMDLDSSNGTTLNNVAVPPARYVELKTGDVIRFTTDERDSIYELVFVHG